MNTYLKIGSVKNNQQNCNCITPFYIDNITGINPNTGREYSSEDKDAMKTALYRISNAKGCSLNVCCDPNDPTSSPDPIFTNSFIKRFPKIMPIYDRSKLSFIKLSTTSNPSGSGWLDPTPYMICKISKSTITDDPKNSTIKIATKLVNDCFTNQCSNVEEITVNNLLQNSKADMKYTHIDDARVSQAILEGNISYVKEYIKKYKIIDAPLTNDSYSNRMIHIASQSKHTEILNMLIALKANLNIKNKLNETPIHFAVKSAMIDNIDTLLTQGVDLSISTINGETPMFYAMKTGNIAIIKMLYNNNSPLLGVDKDGNNLIHYCIKNCPSFVENDDENIDNKITAKTDKRIIINFLIERGINSEQLNNDGITPLELTKKEINREINKECFKDIEKENNIVTELFFNMKPIREAMSMPSQKSKDNATPTNASQSTRATPTNASQPTRATPTNAPQPNRDNNYGAKSISQELSGYTPEHKSLLEIQTILFNNVIKNNPKKYNDYISVDDIPKGAPIEVLDTVCVGSGMSGNEDSDECVAKGGNIVKIKNRTTKIKLELIPEDDTIIDKVNDKDLYFEKYPNKIPKGTIPPNIKNYNNTILDEVPQTTGITYNLGSSSTSLLSSIEQDAGFNPHPTSQLQINQLPTPTQISQSPTPTQMNQLQDHPPEFDDYDDVVHKCKKDAIRNSETLVTTKSATTPQTTIAENIKTIQIFTDKYKIPLIVLSVIIFLLIIGIIIYYFYYKQEVI